MYLTPAAIGYLTELILALVIAAYLGYRFYVSPDKGRDHHLLVTGIYAVAALLVALLFFDAASSPTHRLISVYLQNTVIGILLTLLLQFAYIFPQRRAKQKLESRLILAASLAYTLYEAGFAIYRGTLLWREGIVRYRPLTADVVLAVGFMLVPLTFIRQVLTSSPSQPAWRALWQPRTQDAKTARALVLPFLLSFFLILLVIARSTALIHPAVFQTATSVGLLLILLFFGLAYLNALPEMVSFQIRLVGTTLVTVLAVFGAVGWVISPTHTADFRPALMKQQTLRFSPNNIGGYDIAQVPYAYESALGSKLEMGIVFPGGGTPDAQVAVPFNFPFYGTPVDTLWIMRSGAVGMGQPLHFPSMEYHYGSTPAIFPLFVALDSVTGGVYASQHNDHLTVTWHDMQGWHDPDLSYTFQLVLYRNGEFTITMQSMPDQSYDYNSSPFSLAWVTGVTPGLVHGSPQRVDLTDLPLQTGVEGALHDHYLGFREYMHPLLSPIAVLVFISSLVVIIVFPVVLYKSLSQPLNALLAGVRQVQTGDLEVTMPVYYHDEVGYLAQAFNENLAQLRDLILDLEMRVAKRTQDLADTNNQLRDEISEREAVQAQLLEQQRILVAYEEREILGRELHDGLGQTLGYLNVQSQAVQTLLDKGQVPAAQANLGDLIHAAQKAHTDIRAYILGLRQLDNTHKDFLMALRTYITDMAQRYELDIVLSLPENLPEQLFTSTVEEQALHIVQEAVSNTCRHAQASRVEVTIQQIDSYIQLIIMDDGHGFDSRIMEQTAVLDELDVPHFGLHMMRERAEYVGGSLAINTAPGKGTRLMALLPRFMPGQAAAGEEHALQGLRILLADDHPLFLEGLRNLLTARGVTVVGTAKNGQEALEKARILHPDVAVLDLNMPVLDGLKATRAIKAELPETKVVLLTVSEKDQHLFEAMRNGASGYLLKNLDANTFCSLLAGLMQGETALAPGMAERLLAEFVRPKQAEDALTTRQWDILHLVADGLIYKEIGTQLHLSEGTIKYHIGQILEKLHVQTRSEAITWLKEHQGEPD